MAQINVKIDDDVKAQADKLFNQLGLNLTTAINIFIQQSIYQRGLPFEVKLDPFYSDSNMAHLNTVLEDEANGFKNFHSHELIEVDEYY
jgi:DNA-damage-inducible protein J